MGNAQGTWYLDYLGSSKSHSRLQLLLLLTNTNSGLVLVSAL
jgi:hypothetical protein